MGFIATTTYGGAQASHKSYLSPLSGRHVYVWPDKDKAGRQYAERICVTLHSDFGTLPKIIPVSDFALRNASLRNDTDQVVTSLPNALYRNVSYQKGWDAADVIAAGWSLGNVNALLKLATPHEVDSPDTVQQITMQPAANENDAPELFDGIDLWHTPEGKPFASIKRGGHGTPWETFALESAAFKRLLAHAAYQASGKVPPAVKPDDQVRQMIGEALFEGERCEVFTRIGRVPDTLGSQSIDLNLGLSDWSSVHITMDGWSVRNGETHISNAP